MGDRVRQGLPEVVGAGIDLSLMNNHRPHRHLGQGQSFFCLFQSGGHKFLIRFPVHRFHPKSDPPAIPAALQEPGLPAPVTAPYRTAPVGGGYRVVVPQLSPSCSSSPLSSSPSSLFSLLLSALCSVFFVPFSFFSALFPFFSALFPFFYFLTPFDLRQEIIPDRAIGGFSIEPLVKEERRPIPEVIGNPSVPVVNTPKQHSITGRVFQGDLDDPYVLFGLLLQFLRGDRLFDSDIHLGEFYFQIQFIKAVESCFQNFLGRYVPGAKSPMPWMGTPFSSKPWTK